MSGEERADGGAWSVAVSIRQVARAGHLADVASGPLERPPGMDGSAVLTILAEARAGRARRPALAVAAPPASERTPDPDRPGRH